MQTVVGVDVEKRNLSHFLSLSLYIRSSIRLIIFAFRAEHFGYRRTHIIIARSPFSSSQFGPSACTSPFFLAHSLSARVLCSLAVIRPLVRSRLVLIPFSGDVVKYGLKRSLSIPPISLDYREIALPFSPPPIPPSSRL